MAKFIKLERISLKNHPDFTEAKLQTYIVNNPSVLGLGELTSMQRERIQPSGGRLDMLMADDMNGWYEIELQLGDVDPDHIIRTIEYWDTERKRYPQYDHCAVIIAEEITGRFLNVISLFNGNIPLIAMQVSAHKVSENEVALIFTKVLDRVSLGTDEVEAFEQTDRRYWEKKSTPQMLALVDTLFSSIIEATDGFILKYNKFYIGLSKDGNARNFISFKPKKNFLWLNIKYPLEDEFGSKLEQCGLEYSYDNRWRQYAVRISSIDDYAANKDVLNSLCQQAKKRFNV